MIEKRVSNVGMLDYITHAWIGQCANSKLVTDTGSHVTLRIHLMYSMPYVRYSLSIINSCYYQSSYRLAVLCMCVFCLEAELHEEYGKADCVCVCVCVCVFGNNLYRLLAISV